MHLISAGDLPDSAIESILDRAEVLTGGPRPETPSPLLGTLFLTPSMRTRIGFEVASLRMGGRCVSVHELRVDHAMSAAESFADALRVLGGMVDVVVTRNRTGLADEINSHMAAVVVNGGDATEHPTQALIDLAAIRKFAGPTDRLTVALCGDLRMRAVTSLLSLLSRRPPERLLLMHPDSRGPLALPVNLLERTVRVEPGEVQDTDVLVVVGLPPGSGPAPLDWAARAPYILTGDRLGKMKKEAVVLSPMPVIDEIDASARGDNRIRMFAQSDHGVQVRMAVLEHVLGGTM